MVSICSFDKRHDRTCLIEIEHIPDAELDHLSFVAYDKIFSVPHRSYGEMLASPRGGYICDTPPDTLVRVLKGLSASPFVADEWRNALFKPSVQPEFQILGTSKVKVEHRGSTLRRPLVAPVKAAYRPLN